MPFAFGISEVPVLRFVLLNIIGAGIWALVVGSAGYIFGHALEQVLGDLRQFERLLFALVAIAGAIVWAFYLFRRNRSRGSGPIPPGRQGKTMKNKPNAWIGPLFGALLFFLAIWVLHHELAAHRLKDIVHQIRAIPHRSYNRRIAADRCRIRGHDPL